MGGGEVNEVVGFTLKCSELWGVKRKHKKDSIKGQEPNVDKLKEPVLNEITRELGR
ncbi:hypothetical protein RND71_030606 [Anisodus tanguticus]|uniref:Uncharacterized protein n=1 Tax=Anisodus tanguticus TaxID=243964 RepID=A0AAE1UZV5_9SOLA|nr:hypothetical protein RND71_030606 [Anisodus tanguticus]